jgi:hypothetical protein
MGWLMSYVDHSLVMAVLTIATLRQSIRTRAFTLPGLDAGDRLITVFVVSTSALASIYGLTLLAAKILP